MLSCQFRNAPHADGAGTCLAMTILGQYRHHGELAHSLGPQDLVTKVRALLLGREDKALLELIEAHPIIAIVGLILGGKSARDLAEPIVKAQAIANNLALAATEFTALGWALSSQVPIGAYTKILNDRLAGSSDDETNAALVRAWNEAPVLALLGARIKTLGAADDDLSSGAAARSRLVQLAWQHHCAGAFEASVPIVLAQIDGISHDATSNAAHPDGRSFFSMDTRRQADVADNETLAGAAFGLPAVRAWFSARYIPSASRGTVNRHGVLHGRELHYDTLANSTRSFVLLLAVWEWANRRLAATAQERKQARYALHAGSDDVDDRGCRLDRRGFSETRLRLKRLRSAEDAYRLATGHYGNVFDLILEPRSRDHVGADPTCHSLRTTQTGWWVDLCSEAGWWFAIGSDGTDYWFYDGPARPIGAPWAAGWRIEENGNWSGDCCW